MGRESISALPAGSLGVFWIGGGHCRAVLDPRRDATNALLERVLSRFPHSAGHLEHLRRGLTDRDPPRDAVPVLLSRNVHGLGPRHLVGYVTPRVASEPGGREAVMLAVEAQNNLHSPLVFACADDADGFIQRTTRADKPIHWSRFEVETRVRNRFEAVHWAVKAGHDSEASPIPLTDLESLLDQALQREDFRARRLSRLATRR